MISFSQENEFEKISIKEKALSSTTHYDSLTNLYFSLYELYYYADKEKSDQYLNRYFEEVKEKKDSLRLGIYFYRVSLHDFYEMNYLEAAKKSEIASVYLKNKDTFYFLESVQLQLRSLNYTNNHDRVREIAKNIYLNNSTAYENFPLQVAKLNMYIGLSIIRSDSALYYYQKAVPLLTANPKNNILLHVYHHISEYYKQINQLDSALKYAKLSFDLARDTLRYNEIDFLLPAHNYQDILNRMGYFDRAVKIANEIQIQRNAAKILRIEYPKMSSRQAYLNFLRSKDREHLLLLLVVIVVFVMFFIVFSVFFYRINANKKMLKRSNDFNELLLRENHHRVKNNYQLMMSLINVYGSKSNMSHTLFLEHLRSKIISMAKMHEVLLKIGPKSEVDSNYFFMNLIESLKESLSLDQQKIVLSMNNTQQKIKIDYVIALGMIINELVTNTVKHAYNLNASGKIHISFITENSHYHIKYEEIGLANNYQQIKSNGHGLEIIKSLVKQINGEISFSYDHGGAVVFIKFTP
jgi:two-component sensor histidine kinase